MKDRLEKAIDCASNMYELCKNNHCNNCNIKELCNVAYNNGYSLVLSALENLNEIVPKEQSLPLKNDKDVNSKALIVYENKLKDDTNTLIRDSLEYACDYCDSPIGNPIEINIKKKYCAIESFLNLVQSAVDLLYESGISAEDIINYYDRKRD